MYRSTSSRTAVHPFTQREWDSLDFDEDDSGDLFDVTEPAGFTAGTSSHLAYQSLAQPHAGSQKSSSPLWARHGRDSYANKENRQLGHRGSDLASATHHELLACGNKAYESLYKAYVSMRGENKELKNSYERLLDAMKTNPMADSGPHAAFRIPTSGKFISANYPAIRFPTKRQYNLYNESKAKQQTVLDPTQSPIQQKKQCGGTRLALNNENILNDFIEDEHGVIVTGDTAKNICAAARAILIQMGKDSNCPLPEKWGDFGITETKFFIREMYAKYPYLWLCEDDWKVRQLGSTAVSQCRRAVTRKTEKTHQQIKSEMIRVKMEPAGDSPMGAWDHDGGSAAARHANDDDDDDDIYVPRSLTTSQRKAEAPSQSLGKRSNPPLVYDLTCSDADDAVEMPATKHHKVVAGNAAPPPVPSPPTSAESSPTVQNALENNTHSISPSVAATSVNEAENRSATAPSHATAIPAVPVFAATSVSQDAPPPSTTAVPVVNNPILAIENPFAALFGPAAGPSGRADSLKDTMKPDGKLPETTVKGSDSVGVADSNDEAEAFARSKVFGPGMKRITNSSSAKNLYYIKYLQTNDPVSPASFDVLWSALPKTAQKEYAQLSKERK
ncbi:hypothetical protein HYPSUDRAFT_206473 [Hypholoma sublateritium FD-334 SS-4]|uniref:Uncharacterized protein n=1 Tax=Hypholoma sublateritium (strain FD-334 SS-4) TaxID=945553 RepID=A0A0D2NKL7_HYPSF|nr:hypothetical protein HYPSUDRAFT_206473 [Hypholoma sublateritium FD-334 SS-4]